MDRDVSLTHLESWLLFAISDKGDERNNHVPIRRLCYFADGILTVDFQPEENEKSDDNLLLHLSDIEDIVDTSDGSNFSFSLRKDNLVYSFAAGNHIIVQRWLTALRVESTGFDVHTSLKSFKLLSVIGRGYSGEVILARYVPSGKLVALKSIPKDGLGSSSNSVKHALAERNILMKVATPFITRLLSAFQTHDNLFIALEFVPGGDLGYHISKGRTFSPKQVQIYLAEIAIALSYIHKLGIIFRDLKPGNILVDAKGHLKLTDFGLSKYLLVEDHTTSMCGTHEYLAPEMIKGASYNFAVDWWSFGVLAYQLLEGVLPFESPNLNKLYERIARSPLKFWKPITCNAKAFIQKLLQKDPSKRLGCTSAGEGEIFDNPYFDGIDWDKIKNKEYQMEFIPDISKDQLLLNFDCGKTNQDDVDSMYDECSFNNESHIPGFSYAGQGLESPLHELSGIVF